MFDVLAAAGLPLWPSAALHGAARWRTLLDGALVARALVILSWVTALGTIVHVGGTSRFSYTVLLGYPLSDLVLTLTVVAVAHARQGRSGLGLLAVGWPGCVLLGGGEARRSAGRSRDSEVGHVNPRLVGSHR